MLNLTGLAYEALFVAMAVEFIATMMGTSVSAIAPQISESLHVSGIFIGVYTGAFYFGACLSSLTGGNFIRKYGAAKITGIGLLITAASMAMCTIPIFAVAVVSGFILGIGKGPLMPAINAMVSHQITKAQYNKVFAVKQCIGPIGFITSGALLPYITKVWGWQAALAGLAVGGVIVAIISFCVVHSQDKFKVPSEKISLKGETMSLKMALTYPGLPGLCIVSFIYKGLQMCITAYLVVYLASLGYNLIFAGFALACTSLGAIFGRLIWGWNTDKFGPHRILGCIGVLMGVFTIILTQLGPNCDKWIILLISTLIGMNSLGWDGIFFAQIAAHVPSDRIAEATGGVDFFNFMGAIFVPIGFGFLGTAIKDYAPGYWIISGLTILTGIILFFTHGKSKPDPQIEPIHKGTGTAPIAPSSATPSK